MKTYTLSPRLQVIADFAAGKNVVADIGCDHGKISVYLAENGSKVHAVDISEPSLNKARELAKAEGVEDRMAFHCDDGLESIKHVELDAVIIAGMGHRMIRNILENNLERVMQIDSLILQPMDNVIEMRKYLNKHNYSIIDEKLVWDDNRLYTVIAAKYQAAQKLKLKEILLGPMIIKNNDELLRDLIDKELKKRHSILNGLNKAQNKDKKQIEQVENEIEILNKELRGIK